ncbi:MAG TPA: TIGR04282 family arsenosugar biosynthesis glycosyltransferase [Candidatus Deferrimicrobiaceae bacterium]|jgi:hypothetical protein
MREDALILMAKAPIPGRVKTRMCPPLSPRDAAGLYACLLADASAEAARLRDARRYLWYAPPERKSYFLGEPFSPFLLRRQEGSDLGERMARAIDEAFAGGARRAVIVGADCPALSAGRIRSAFRELACGADAVFGPAADGGFYLAGLCAPDSRLFRDVEWSASSVLSEVLSRCRLSGMTYALLPVESDVDTPDDLAGLLRWASTHRAPACPRTRRWLGEELPRITCSRARISSGRREGRASCRFPGPRSRSGG